LIQKQKRSSLLKRLSFPGRDGSKGILKERASESLNCKEVSTVENMNQQPNKSKTYRVSPDTVAFMLSSGFSTDGSWYQWVKKNRQQVTDR
jgi:murein tripeptide amidase MpaA